MLNILFNFVFKLVLKLFDLITMPFFAILYALFPDLSTTLTNITSFLTSALTYIGFFPRMLMLPSGWFSALFSYFSIKLTIFLAARTFKFGLNIYQKFKP